MNYKKNLILLLSIVNIALVIILLVNKKINIELFSQCGGQCPQTQVESRNRTEVDDCSGPEDEDDGGEGDDRALFPHYFILYFLINDPDSCPYAQSVNTIYDSYFVNEDQFYCTHTIKGNTAEFYSFLDCNDCTLCSETTITSPAIFIRYPYKREFLKLPANGYHAIEYDKPNTRLSILSVSSYPLANEFVERVKKSKCQNYRDQASCETFRTEAFSLTLTPERKVLWEQHLRVHRDDCSTERTFTDCDNTHQCSSN